MGEKLTKKMNAIVRAMQSSQQVKRKIIYIIKLNDLSHPFLASLAIIFQVNRTNKIKNIPARTPFPALLVVSLLIRLQNSVAGGREELNS